MSFFLFTIAVILLGIFIRVFWYPLLIIAIIIKIIIGIVLSSALTAVCFQFFTWVLSKGEDYGSFTTIFEYALVFFTVATIAYICIISDIIDMGVNFIRYIFKK